MVNNVTIPLVSQNARPSKDRTNRTNMVRGRGELIQTLMHYLFFLPIGHLLILFKFKKQKEIIADMSYTSSKA